MKTQRTIRRFINSEVMSREAARYVSDVLTCAVRRQGHATLVLSGGSTPRRLYTLLATVQYAYEIPWQSVHFFWGDERWVTSSDPCSNYKMAFDALFSRVPVASGNIHRIQTELGWQESAVAYEDELRMFFGKRGAAEAGLFDMVLLGMGTDGHTASLFPDSPTLDEQACWVAAVEAAKDICTRKRITLTLPLLNRARHVLFLVAGKEKRGIVDTIVKEGDGAAQHYPAARIRASEQVVFFYA
jgi:6-phosphogluconolactonase